MLKNYAKYSKKIDKFREEIYFYCDYNVGSDVLFPAFVNLWPENNDKKKAMTKRDLVLITSNILHELVDRDVLKTMHKEDSTVYSCYNVLPHEFLLDHASFIEKQKMLKFKL
jgi:hypothetical protein